MEQMAPVSFRRLISFFIPLGISASLVTISHVIINATLTRGTDPKVIVATYAIGLSLLSVTERPAVLLRQTCSTLVRDRISFRAMSIVSVWLFLCLLLFGAMISYTPIGPWIFVHVFGANPDLLGRIIAVFRVLMFVSLFSGLRCLFHGVIISNFRTKWLTIGMLIRLIGMMSVAAAFAASGPITSGVVGAVIFLAGMMIEAFVSIFEGRRVLRELPEKAEGHDVTTARDVLRFYRPLLYSSFIAVLISPSINAFLGKTIDLSLSVAAYALASSLMQLVTSFFSYVHQIVLNFYKKDRKAVFRFLLMLCLVPSLLVALLGYTPIGDWVLVHVMGADPELHEASVKALRVFVLYTLIFPWLDYGNGLLMLLGQTRTMVWSQASNVSVTLLTLVVTIHFWPSLNGAIGSLALSLGVIAEAAAVGILLRMGDPLRQAVLLPGNFSSTR